MASVPMNSPWAGYGHAPPGVSPGFRFTTKSFQWPLNLGIQAPYWQAGGPSGFVDGTAGAIRPYPYMTAFKNFITAFPYGAASSLLGNPNGPNLGSQQVAFLPMGGLQKMPTFTNVTY